MAKFNQMTQFPMAEFISLINQYDIIGVQESKLDDVDSIAINGYSIYTKKS